MATSTMNPDGTLTVLCTPTERATLDGVPVGQFDGYMTLWLADHAQAVFARRFEKLADVDKTEVMTKIQAVEEAEKD